MPPGAPPAGGPATPTTPDQDKGADNPKKELTADEHDKLPEEEKEKYQWNGEKYALKEDAAPGDGGENAKYEWDGEKYVLKQDAA